MEALEKVRRKNHKICFFSSGRSDYNILNPVFECARKRKLDFGLLIAGTHSHKKFGSSIENIKKDKFNIYGAFKTKSKINSFEDEARYYQSNYQQALEKLESIRPKCIYVLGDRIESLAVAQAAFYLRIPVIHSGGGAITNGSMDNSNRYAITHFAAIHLTVSSYYRDRLIKIGEEKWRIFNVGSPAVDHIAKVKKVYSNRNNLDTGDLLKGLEGNKLALVTYHPVNNARENTLKAIKNIVTCLLNRKFDILITYPNIDFGSEEIIDLIKQYERKNRNKIKFTRYLGKDYYKVLLKTGVVVGNSSSGIIETPYFNVPAINVGRRQEGRAMDSNVINCGISVSQIENALGKCLDSLWKKKNLVNNFVFGKSGSSDRTIKIVEKIINTDDQKLLQKKII